MSSMAASYSPVYGTKNTATKSSAVSIFSTQENSQTKTRSQSQSQIPGKVSYFSSFTKYLLLEQFTKVWNVNSSLDEMAARGSLTDSMHIWSRETVPNKGMGREDNLGGLYYCAKFEFDSQVLHILALYQKNCFFIHIVTICSLSLFQELCYVLSKSYYILFLYSGIIDI